jgi:hypothetical protein
MNKKRIKILIAVTFGILALTVCLSASDGEPPVSEVILESISRPVEGQDYWEGPATIWVDGVMYEGTVLYMHEGGTMDDNRWYGDETQDFDFGDLGTLTVSGIAITTFDYVSPNHRWHNYTSHSRITNGTGAFAEANGVVLFRGYTDWEIDPESGLPISGSGWGGAMAKIVGIQLPESAID